MASADTGTAQGRYGGRDVAAQPVSKPRRRGSVRGRSPAGPVVPAPAAAGHCEPVHGQRDGGRSGPIADDHGSTTMAGRGDHVRAGHRPAECGERVVRSRRRSGHAGRGRLRGLLDRAPRDHSARRVAAGAQRVAVGHHMLPKGPVQVSAADGPPGRGRPLAQTVRGQAAARVRGRRGRGRRTAAGQGGRLRPGGRCGRGNGDATPPPSPAFAPPSCAPAPAHAPPARGVTGTAVAAAAAGRDRCAPSGRRPRHDVPEGGQTIVQAARARRGRRSARATAQRVGCARHVVHATQAAAAAPVRGRPVPTGVATAARPADGRRPRPNAQDRHAQDAGGRHERDEGLTNVVLRSIHVPPVDGRALNGRFRDPRRCHYRLLSRFAARRRHVTGVDSLG